VRRWMWLGVGLALGCEPADKAGAPDDTHGVDCTAPGVWFADADGDGFGDSARSETTCTPEAGWVTDGSDCDDTAPGVHPDAAEVCNGLDDDCDGLLDADDDDTTDLVALFVDADGDGVGGGETAFACPGVGWADAGGDCDDADSARAPGLSEVCDDAGVDEDCDDLSDCADSDCDGSCPEDCDDGRDNDGNGLLDCEDAACLDAAPCIEGPGECNDGRDNDRDGLRDCYDDDCWNLGVCATATFTVDAVGELHFTRRQYSYAHFGTGGLSNYESTEERLSFDDITGHLRVATVLGSASCGLALDHGYMYQVVGDNDGRRFSSSASSGALALDSACSTTMMAGLVPELFRDASSASSGRVLLFRFDGVRGSLAAARGWDSHFTSDRDHTSYFGTTGYGSPTSYGRWWDWRTTFSSATSIMTPAPTTSRPFYIGE